MNRVITISRQYGSGGRELGEKLAARLGIPFYDKELVGMIAREGKIETAVLEAYDEVEPDLDNYSLRDVPPDYQIAMTQKLYAAQCRVILDLAAKGPLRDCRALRGRYSAGRRSSVYLRRNGPAQGADRRASPGALRGSGGETDHFRGP